MTDKDVRIAVVGCGGIAREHIGAIQELGTARIVAAADCDVQAGRLAAQRTGGKPYLDYCEMFETEHPDAVVIATPPNAHRDIAIAALDSGAHVLCEKPLAAKSLDAQEMIENARSAGRMLMTAFCHRFHEPVMLAKELIESGQLGPLIMFRNRFGGKQDMSATWFSKKEFAGGGALMDTAIHSVDLFRYLVGEVRNVSARMLTHDGRIDVEDSGIMLLESSEGIIGTIEASWATPGSANVIEVYGNSGAVFVDYVGGFKCFTEGSGGWIQPELSGTSRFVRQMEHFLECVRDGKQPRVTGEDGLEALKIMEAAYRSVERNCFERPEIPLAE